ncbi:hypothetical protein [Kolpuevirus frurule]|uniref:Uncharacterized protein n=1 Tax=Kolpuevirus sp. 'frurule' TaxID=3028514 RepID=A0AAF0DPW3_9CAUD|nr:hypothetical protein [Kolpuevirus sp. 'frurule']
MEKRNISISLEKAREWYEGGNITLKQLALEAYSEEELKKKTTYSDVLDELWRSDKLVTDQISISSITTSGVEKIKVLSKLYTIAAYFNGDWVPSSGTNNYYIGKSIGTIEIVLCNSYILLSVPYFKNKEDAQKALEMLSSDELDVLFK